MIDRLLTCKGQLAEGILNVKEDNVFLNNGSLTESGMIEALAQTAAARTGWIAHNEDSSGKANVPVGVIGSIKDFQLYSYPATGDELTTEIEVLHEFMNASVIKGKVMVNKQTACELEMKIFLTEQNAD